MLGYSGKDTLEQANDCHNVAMSLSRFVGTRKTCASFSWGTLFGLASKESQKKPTNFVGPAFKAHTRPFTDSGVFLSKKPPQKNKNPNQTKKNRFSFSPPPNQKHDAGYTPYPQLVVWLGGVEVGG